MREFCDGPPDEGVASQLFQSYMRIILGPVISEFWRANCNTYKSYYPTGYTTQPT